MKKSIAFLGALLFGSVTFAQVNKNDTINKSSSRKVSADDLKKLPPEIETTEKSSIYMKLGDIKGERGIKTEKHSSDASAGKGSKIKVSVTQKMNESESVKITEKQHHTIKMTNAAKAAKDSTNEKTKALNPYLKIKGQKKE